MEFGVIGISYQKTALQKREGASFSDTQKLAMYDALLDIGITQAIILTTCNRSEIYLVYEHEDQIKGCKDCFIKQAKTIDTEDVFMKFGKEALLYLFEVCGGYHSMIPGEDQILGQMKDAYAFAEQAGACRKELHKIMQTCFACIKHTKHTYRISEVSTSIGYLAYLWLQAQTTLHDAAIMIIGSGEMAQLMLQYLKDCNARMFICSRTSAHAKRLKKQLPDLEWIVFEQRYVCAKQCDIILSATASPHVIIKKEAYPKTDHRQFLVDLASPRDIDAALQDDQHILCNLDDLQALADEHRQERITRMENAHEEIVEEAEKLTQWLAHTPIDLAIRSLQQCGEQQAAHTYAMLKKKLSLSPHEERVMKKVLETAFLRMVKEPILNLKQLEETDQLRYAAMVERLFTKEEDTCNIS